MGWMRCDAREIKSVRCGANSSVHEKEKKKGRNREKQNPKSNYCLGSFLSYTVPTVCIRRIDITWCENILARTTRTCEPEAPLYSGVSSTQFSIRIRTGKNHEVHTHVQGKMIAELSLHIIMQLHKRVFIRTKLSLILRWSSLIGHVQKTFSNRLKQTRLRTDEARCAPTSKIKMNALQKTDNKKLQDRRCSGGE
jgi:hypothetical protein